MAKYVDGFVLAVPKDKLSEYKKMAEDGGKIWKKHGALQYVECVREDLSPNMQGAEFLKFPLTVNAGPDETVVFSFITYESREHRDQVNKAVMEEMMQDPKNKDKDMPFDMKRMAYGGFEAIVDL